MVLKVADRSRIPPFIVMDVMRAAAERAAAGGDVLHLEVGQPSTGIPTGLVRELRDRLGADHLGYTLALGVPELRRRIVRHYAETYGVAVPFERVVATAGSSGGFVLAFLAAFEAGDRVGLAAPGYPAYRNILEALGCRPVTIPVDGSTHFQPDVAALERLASAGIALDGLIVASPSNPTGSMLPAPALAALARYCDDHGIRLISDEIYHGIVHGEPAATAAAFTANAIVVNSFSKYYCMTGWRLGWMVVPEDLVRAIECLAQNLFISPPTLSQHAGTLVFGHREELDANVSRYGRNRALLLEELPKAGFDRLAPADGAFYLYADIGHLTDDSPAFCRRMLAETGVAATPGVDFDRERGHRFMRFCFAGPTDDMAEAARRLRRWMG